MITIYIKKFDNRDIKNNTEKDNIKKLFEKIENIFIKKFNILQIKEIEENRKIYLISNIDKTSSYNKIIKKLKREKTKTEKIQLVLSNEVKKYKSFFTKFKIITGSEIYKNLTENILKKIFNEDTLKFKNIYVLSNQYKKENINFIRDLSNKVKTINIITKEIDKYNIFEEMMKEWGIPISIANNKRKSLKNAKIIINLDFSMEELSKYIIQRDALIINLTQEKVNKLKGFNGIIIQDVRN